MTESEIEAAYREYMEGGSVDEICRKYGIPINPKKLGSWFPDRVTEHLCPYCQVQMLQKRELRSRKSPGEPYCPECGHHMVRIRGGGYGNHIRSCGCDGCSLRRAEEIEDALEPAREKLREWVMQCRKMPVPWESLSLKHQLAVLHLLTRPRAITPFNTLSAVDSFAFFPTLDATQALLKELLKSNVLMLNPEAHRDCFERRLDGVVPLLNSFDWLINLTVDGRIFKETDSVSHLCHQMRILLSDPSCESSVNLFLCEMCFLEAQAYLSLLLIERKLLGEGELVSGLKLSQVLKQLAESQPMRQVFYLCYLAARNASDAKLIRNITSRHAVNTIPGHLEHLGNACKTWNTITRYNRDNRLAANNLMETFLGRVLDLPADTYLEHTPQGFVDAYLPLDAPRMPVDEILRNL